MPRLPEPVIRHILADAIALGAPSAQIPSAIPPVVTITLPIAPGRTPTYEIAVRTITRDTRVAGVWVDRLKIQLTTLQHVPRLDAILGVTIIGDEPIIVSIDPGLHIPTQGTSNNVQFPEALVSDALAAQGIVEHVKDSGEIVRAFPSSQLVPFLLTYASEATAIPTADYRTYRARTRDPRFASAIRALYNDRCAVCGIALGLVEAAHIVAHALSGDDSEANGVCLCPTHHTAFDIADLISFSGDRTIWINTSKLDLLHEQGLIDGTHLVLQPLLPTLAPVAIDQSRWLQARHDLDRQDGTWAPQRDVAY